MKVSIVETILRLSPVAQMGRNLPAIWETWAPSWVGKMPLEKGMATHSRIPAWSIPWTRGYSPWGHKELDMTERLSSAKQSQSYGFSSSHVWM